MIRLRCGYELQELWPAFPWWWFVLLAISCALLQHVPILDSLKPVPRLGLILCCYLTPVLVFRLAWVRWFRRRLKLCKVSSELTSRAREFAGLLGADLCDVRVDNTANGRKRLSAYVVISSGHVFIPSRALDVLPTGELDWMLAHEVAHISQGFPMARTRLLWISSPAMLAAFTWLAHLDFAHPRSVVTLVLILPVVSVLSRWDYRLSREQELTADRAALKITGNLQAAESVLRKLAQASEHPSLHRRDTTHPRLSRRIEALREAATESGLRGSSLSHGVHTARF